MRALICVLLAGCATQPVVIPSTRQAEYERHMDEIARRNEDTARRYYEACAKAPQEPCPPLMRAPTQPAACLMTVDGVSVCP